MGFGELGVDFSSYNSQKLKIDHFELIWKYQNEQKLLLWSATVRIYNTSTLNNQSNGILAEKWSKHDSMRIIQGEMKYSENNNDRAQE